MKPYLFLCGRAASGVANLLNDDFSIITVRALDASDINVQFIAPNSFAIVAVGLGGETGGGQAEAIAYALCCQRVRVFLVATMPSRNEGYRRFDRAHDQLGALSAVAGCWVYGCDSLIKKYGECSLPEMYEYYKKEISANILIAKGFDR